MSTAPAALLSLPLQSEWEIPQAKAVMKSNTMAKKILCRSYSHLVNLSMKERAHIQRRKYIQNYSVVPDQAELYQLFLVTIETEAQKSWVACN